MAITRLPCPSCSVVLRLADATPPNTLIRCPKCGKQFRTPPAAQESDRVILSAEVKAGSRVPRSSMTANENDAALLRKIYRSPPRSRTGLWMALGVLAAGVVLVLGAVGIGLAFWLRQWSSNPSPAPAPVGLAPPAAKAPPAQFVPPAAAPQGLNAEDWFVLGNRRMQQGNLNGAIDAFTQAIALNPRHAGAYCNRGLTRGYQDDFEGAIADATKAIELNPKDPFPFINRANARIRKGVDPQASIADASRALELRPNIPAALFNLGMARDQNGDYDGALAEFDKALKLLPTFAMAYAQRGQTRSKLKQWHKAEVDFTSALELKFVRPDIYAHRGVCRLKQGNREAARADFDTAFRLNPSDLKILLTLGEGEEALAAANRGVTRRPQSSAALVFRAFLHAWRGENDKALADYTAAINANPPLVIICLQRGWLYFSLGREDEAAQDADIGLKRAGRLHRQTPYLAILAHCARRRRHLDEARRVAAEELSKGNRSKWPAPVLRYLHGDMSAEELLRAAADNGQRTEAHAYLGVALWLSGAEAKAREHLEWARDHGPRNFIEYDLALLLLQRMDKKPPRKPQ